MVFLQSAINQVGRDMGLVASNAIFKDRHSIPIRKAKSYNYSHSSSRQRSVQTKTQPIQQVQDEFIVSSALKRVNKNDSSKRVIEDEVFTSVISKLVSGEIQNHFFNQINFKNLYKTNFETLYKDYFSSTVNYKSSIAVSKILNNPKLRTKENLDTLHEIDELELKITNLDNLIKNENRTNVIVELNTKRYHLKTEITELKKKLTIK